jgi:Ca2+/Na+ antiporter
MLSRSILLSLLTALCWAQQTSSSTVLGIGYGSFIIIASIILWIVVCIASRSTQHPELYSIIAALLPVFFILFFVLMPKKSQQTSATATTDSNFVPHVIFVILFFIMFVRLCGKVDHCFDSLAH